MRGTIGLVWKAAAVSALSGLLPVVSCGGGSEERTPAEGIPDASVNPHDAGASETADSTLQEGPDVSAEDGNADAMIVPDAGQRDSADSDGQPDASERSCGLLQNPEACHPLAFFFRQSENPYWRQDGGYERWNTAFSRLMGIEGKALEEEVPGRSVNIVDFSRFKAEHPDQLVLLHFDGMARDPTFDISAFSAGNWLYHPGAKVKSDVPAAPGQTTIEVVNANWFKIQPVPDDVVICELKAGLPDWDACEQTTLVSVNATLTPQHIVVERGKYGTTPRAFVANSAYAAAHVASGPYGTHSRSVWNYNYSTHAPVPQGRRTYEVLAADIAARFSAGGKLQAFDGIEFDVLFFERSSSGRGIDFNGDGTGDNGQFGGVNTYGRGVVAFTSLLRAALPDKLILADGGKRDSQRSFGRLNGIESEGWPDSRVFSLGADGGAVLDSWRAVWSEGLNRHLYWQANAHPPKLSYINHVFRFSDGSGTYDAGAVPFGLHRLVMAAAVLTDSAFTYVLEPERNTVEEPIIGIWDELVRGVDARPGWLGRGLGPARHLAADQPDLLLDGPGMGAALVSRFAPSEGTTLSASGGVLTASNLSAAKVSFALRQVHPGADSLLVLVTADADPLNGMPPTVPRLATLRATATGLCTADAAPQAGADLMTWVGQQPFVSSFYYPKLPSTDVVDLCFSIEGSGPVRIREIAAYAHPDVMVRAFEGGVVLANPSPTQYEFNLAQLFPNRRFRMIQGRQEQDRETNNGKPVVGTLMLPATDAAFLVALP
jgi:hypothetical protein